MKLAAVCAAVLAACAGIDREEEIKVQNLRYYRDNRTALCFVSYRLYSDRGFISNVPCTAAVNFLIQGAPAEKHACVLDDNL